MKEHLGEYVSAVSIDGRVIETVSKTYKDRCGVFVVFKLVKHKNEEMSARVVLEVCKDIFSLLGYTREHFRNVEFGEMAEAYVYKDADNEWVKIVHKYWSGKKCKLCADILERLCKFHNIPITIEAEVFPPHPVEKSYTILMMEK